MLSQPQSDVIKEDFLNFGKSLDKKQLKEFYFLLDDLLQYGQNSLNVAYETIYDLRKES